MSNITGRKILITGAARRIGREFALAASKQGAEIIIHHGHSTNEAKSLAREIEALGSHARIVQADFSSPENAMHNLESLFSEEKELYALVNNAAIFKPVKFMDTSLNDWQTHFDINLTMPFLLSQAFAAANKDKGGRIINILDWRALRPGKDHFPYTIAKSALAALTKATARALAPHFQVNGIALGAILPPADGGDSSNIISQVPAKRWSTMRELTDTLLFLLNGPEYITGEIIHLDGGRHLV